MSTRELDAAGITDPVLRASYQRCKELNAQHGKTYYLATLLLPPQKRPYVHALYGFARYADEIVDDLSDLMKPTGRLLSRAFKSGGDQKSVLTVAAPNADDR